MRTPIALLAALLAATPAPKTPGVEELRRLEAQYAPVDLVVALSKLPESERLALGRLVQASQVVDALFLRQEWAGADAMLLSLQDDPTPLGRARLAFFLRNKGPWDRLDNDRVFIEAHGRGVALQLNWFLDQGGVAVGKDGRFSVVDGKIRGAVESLSREILTLQANGDAAGAKALLDRMGVVRPPVARVLEKLRGIPVDIAPRFVTARKLTQ